MHLIDKWLTMALNVVIPPNVAFPSSDYLTIFDLYQMFISHLQPRLYET